MDKTYNGWKNRETWNIMLWLNNDKGLYNKVKDYIKDCRKRGEQAHYTNFLWYADLFDSQTPDGTRFADPEACRQELTDALQEMLDEE